MNKTVFITGASKGIGKETAKFFAKNNWNVIATMRNPQNENELKEYENILVLQLDVTKTSTIKSAIAIAIEKYGKIDVLVNNAGYALGGPVELVEEEALVKQYNTNVFGMIRVLKEIIPFMRKEKDGIIINVSSMGGRITLPFGSIYESTKYAIEGLSEAMYYELDPFNIKIKILEPGFVSTDFGQSTESTEISYKDNNPYEKLSKIRNENFRECVLSYGTGSTSEEVAQKIYEMSTDNKNQIRYIVGEHAEKLINNRNKQTDEEYVKEIQEGMNLNIKI